MLYELKLGHNAVRTTKNIYCAKGEGIVDHSTVTKWLKKFCLVGWLGFTACQLIGLFYAEYVFIYELTLFTNSCFDLFNS